MDSQVVERWGEYRSLVERLYSGDGEGPLNIRGGGGDAAAEVAAASERLLDRLESVFSVDDLAPDEAGRSAELEETETAAYAAAAVDVRVGADILNASLAEEGAESGIAAPEALIEAARPPAEAQIPIEVLLRRADQVFSPGETAAGAAPGNPFVIARTGDAIDELLASGSPPAAKFGASVLTAGTGQLLDAFGGLDWLRDRARELGGRLHQGLRLIELGLRKMAAPVGTDLLSTASELVLTAVEEIFGQRSEPFVEAGVRRVVRAGHARRHTEAILAVRQTPPDPRTLDAALERLCRNFEKNMRWAGMVQKGLSLAGIAIVLIGGGGPGQLALTGISCFGLVICLHSLADRLDTMPGWIDGVPKITQLS